MYPVVARTTPGTGRIGCPDRHRGRSGSRLPGRARRVPRQILAELTAPGGPFALGDAVVHGVPLRVHVTAPQTLREAHAATARHGSGTFTVHEGERVGFDAHRVRVGTLARRYAEAGLRPGDRVAVCLRNYPEWAPLCWAAWVSGLVVVPLNAWWQRAELEHAVADAAPALVVADGERAPVLRAVTPDDVPVVEVRGTGTPGTTPFDEFLGELGDDRLPDHEPAPDDDATILYTSGTTGRPKGAIGTHRNHCTTSATRRSRPPSALAIGTGSNRPHGPGRIAAGGTVHVPAVPHRRSPCSATRQSAAPSSPPSTAGTPATRGGSSPARGLTSVAGVPTSSTSCSTAVRDGLDELTPLDQDRHGRRPDPGRIGSTGLRGSDAPGNGYGLTETTPTSPSTGRGLRRAPDSGGPPHAGHRRTRGRPGSAAPTCPRAEIGELWFAGRTSSAGTGTARGDREAFVDGWFRTGDLGRVDDGVVQVVDRLKDVVIRGGENIYCSAVEAELLEVDGVLDAAVVGIPHPTYGEEVAAVVVHAPGAVPDEAVLRDRVASRIAAFAAPTTIRTTTDPLPRNAVGKVLKREVR